MASIILILKEIVVQSFTVVGLIGILITMILGSPVRGAVTTEFYHFHNETSAINGANRRLLLTNPNSGATYIQGPTLATTGEKIIEDFETQAGDPNWAHTIPAGSTWTFSFMMSKSSAANTTAYPRVKVRLNSAAGTLILQSDCPTAIPNDTTMRRYTWTANNANPVTLNANDRLFVTAAVNCTVRVSGTSQRPRLGVEGTLGGANDSTITVPIDKSLPITTLNCDPAAPDGTNGWFKTTPTITLSRDESGTTYYSWVSANGPWTTYSNPFSAEQGENTLYYYSVDTIGNTESVTNTAFKVDDGIPSSDITEPSDEERISGEFYEIAGTASDSGDSDIAKVEVSINNGDWQLASDTAYWSYSWTLGDDGDYNIKSRATDNAGNVESADGGIDVTIDNTAPQISSTIPLDDAVDVVASSNITATFNEDMDDTTISTSTFVVKDDLNNPVDGIVTYDEGSKTATFDPNDDLDSPATYSATVTTGVYDLAWNGLESDYVWNFTTLDSTAPITTLTTDPGSPDGSNGWFKTIPTISLTPDETATTYYSWVSDEGPWTMYSAPFSAMTGQNSIWFYSVDGSDNTETPKSQLSKVDTELPLVDDASPVNATTVNSYRPTISATLTDSGSSIDEESITVTLDSVAITTFSYNSVTGVIEYIPGADLSRGRHDVNVVASDIAGNTEDLSWHFTVFGTEKNGTISSNTIWTVDGNPYIVTGSVTVGSGVTLTIESGVVVKFDNHFSALSVQGTLIADGSSENKVVFTSIKDDQYAGDTNNDGSASSPGWGDWHHLYFSPTSTSDSILDYCILKYAGYTSDWYGGIYIYDASPHIQNCEISNNTAGGGIYLRGDSSPQIINNTISYNNSAGITCADNSCPTIQSNTISYNTSNGGYGIVFGGGAVRSPLIRDNSFVGNNSSAIRLEYAANCTPDISGNSATDNGCNAISVFGTLTTSGTWHANDLPYEIGEVIIGSGASLTIEPGTVCKFASQYSRLTIGGSIIANGTPTDNIIFTSLKDDSYGGDTNNNGNATSPTVADWANCRFTDTSNDQQCIMNYCVVKYGGGYPFVGTIICDSSSPTMSNCLISRNYDYGLRCFGDSAPNINYCNFINNEGSNIGNSGTGVINAEYNWWGIARGFENKISGLVDYDPWALSPYSIGTVGGGGGGGGTDPQGRYGSDTPCGYFGEPVNTALGNYVYEHEDLNIPGKGLNLNISRSYNSQDRLYNGVFGYGWTINYNASLRFNSDDSITAMMSDGRRDTYTDAGGGNYTAPQGVFNILTKNQDGTYTLMFKDQFRYEFSAGGSLTAMVDKFGNTTALTYNGSSLLSAVTDAGGRSISFSYINGHVTEIEDEVNRSVQYGYNGSGDLTTVTDMNGKTTTFAYDTEHQLTSIAEPEPSTNPFLTNHYLNGQVDWQKDAFLSLNTYDYDTVNLITTMTDNKGNETVHQFDDKYRLTGSTDPMLNSVTSVFSALNKPDSVTNQNGKTTYFLYDGNGNTTSTEDPFGHEVTSSYDASNNNLLWTKDALLHQTTYEYNQIGDLLESIISPIGTTSFTYYDDGLLETQTDDNDHVTTFAYNDFGNLTSITDPLNKESTFEYDDVGRMTSSIDANLNETQFVYDNQGNILATKDPLAISDPGNRHQVDFTYDDNGNQETFTDSCGNLTQYAYDDMDNLTGVTDASANLTSYAYDENYNLHTVTDAELHTTTYDYYDDNKLWKITDPLDNITEFAYDRVGNLTTTTYPNGNATYMSYYDDNLLHAVTYENEDTSYTYAYNATHTIDSVTDNDDKTYSYTYDSGNRLTESLDETNPSIEGGFDILRSYDGVSNLTSLDFAGLELEFAYNARDDLTTTTLPSGDVVFAYDDARNRTDIDTPDGTNRHYAYDDANRITEVENTTASTNATFSYTHDANGNILTENETTYTYDVLNRLTSWDHDDITVEYDYDDAGNLLEVTEEGIPIKAFTYNAANQITNEGFTYDDNGNMTSDGDNTYIYDGDNRLIEVIDGETTLAAYTYDYMGRRTSVTENGNTTYYHYDGWNVMAETDEAGDTIAAYVYDNGSQPLSMARSGDTYYYQTNAHGDVVSLTDSDGTIVNTYTYDPWGKALSSTEGVSNPYRYAGYRYDETTGLYYLQARYYDAKILRFVTKDLIMGKPSISESWNQYQYCVNNPVNAKDPTGLWHADAHQYMTEMAAARLHMKPNDKCGLGKKSYSFDFGITSAITLPKAHFDMEKGPRDSRWTFAENRLNEAIVLENTNNHEAALYALAGGMHAIQDVYAHGDNSRSWHLVRGSWMDETNKHPEDFRKAYINTVIYLDYFIRATK